MPDEALRMLALVPGATYVDCTTGGGGHARAAAGVVGPTGRLVLIDRDAAALSAAAESLAGSGCTIRSIHGDFRNLASLLASEAVAETDAVLFDLGLSSIQLDDPARGFSFREGGPLDMRMDPASALTAERVVNTWSEADLTRIIRDFGGDPMARRIAGRIVDRRARTPIETTDDLASIVSSATARRGRSRRHPATRTFQALRIAVNDELGALAEALPQALRLLRPGGRLVTIAYHSAEDRICKEFGREAAGCGPRGPMEADGRRRPPAARILTGKGLVPSAEETQANPRSRSARLRALEKLAPHAAEGR